jgi:hypothetical protein
MNNYRLVVQTTRPGDHHRSTVYYDDAIMLKWEDGIVFKSKGCNGELLAYYPLSWAIEVKEIINKETYKDELI